MWTPLKLLAGKVSVRDVLFEFSKIHMVCVSSGRKYLCAHPKKTEYIMEVFQTFMPMAQR
jgi:hypothetical protein